MIGRSKKDEKMGDFSEVKFDKLTRDNSKEEFKLEANVLYIYYHQRRKFIKIINK